METIGMYKLVLMGILLALTSCIDEYYPKGLDSMGDILVVEGIITNDTTVITLRRSVGISEDISNAKEVINASVYVECDDGTVLQNTTKAISGQYEIITGVLNPNSKYRLNILVDGDSYTSEFLSPIITPQIDSIFLSKAGAGRPIYTCVSTHSTGEDFSYYRWSYEEDWEFHSEIYTSYGYSEDNPPLIVEYYDYYNKLNNIYHCWAKGKPNSILLGSTEKYTENKIREKRLIESPASDSRFSVLYHVTVFQNQIRREAYTYYENLQKNVEQTEGLFSPMPIEMKGNIKCINNPDKHVIGYIEVSTTTCSKRFFPKSDNLYEPELKRFCYTSILDTLPPSPEYILISYEGGILSALRVCVDCRYRSGGTKNRPNFWPDN